jgi:hypothetical protein
MEQSERNPNQERDRSRAPGHPSIDRVDELREKARRPPAGEKGRDKPPGDAPRDPSDPWMGGG